MGVVSWSEKVMASLDAAILLPTQPPLTAPQRAAIESGFLVWLFYSVTAWKPELMASYAVDGMSEGLTRDQRRAASDWIRSDPGRLRMIKDLSNAIAPRRHRAAGWANDEANEAGLAPLPFEAVTSPTLIAHGRNDSVAPVEHATHTAGRITGAEVVLVEEGHHALSLCRNFGAVADRELELVRSS